jgi:hypothetical protein
VGEENCYLGWKFHTCEQNGEPMCEIA